MDDFISRQAAIQITNETGALETKKRLKELPTADVMPRTVDAAVALLKEVGWLDAHDIAFIVSVE